MAAWDPQKYEAWYETPLGSVSDRLEQELVFSMAGVKEGERALDAGCGTGIYSIGLAKKGAIVTGLDASQDMLAWARAKALKAGLKIDFIEVDALNLPFPDGHFDMVLSVCMLCLVKEREAALMEMKRVLRPGGRIVVAMLNSRSPWAFFRRVKGLFRRSVYKNAEFLSPRAMERELRMAGYKDIKSKTCLFFLPINSKIYLALSGMEERLGRRLFPETGAFLVAVGTKA
jgi:ubiquinone/menaquinone biosynthesis C-methylase UbiE